MRGETKGRAKAERDGRLLRNKGLEALAELGDEGVVSCRSGPSGPTMKELKRE